MLLDRLIGAISATQDPDKRDIDNCLEEQMMVCLQKLFPQAIFYIFLLVLQEFAKSQTPEFIEKYYPSDYADEDGNEGLAVVTRMVKRVMKNMRSRVGTIVGPFSLSSKLLFHSTHYFYSSSY